MIHKYLIEGISRFKDTNLKRNQVEQIKTLLWLFQWPDFNQGPFPVIFGRWNFHIDSMTKRCFYIVFTDFHIDYFRFLLMFDVLFDVVLLRQIFEMVKLH